MPCVDLTAVKEIAHLWPRRQLGDGCSSGALCGQSPAAASQTRHAMRPRARSPWARLLLAQPLTTSVPRRLVNARMSIH